MNRRLQVTKYVFLDWLSALIAWSLFYLFRKYSEDPEIFSHIEQITDDRNFWQGIIFVPVFWLVMYLMMGSLKWSVNRERLDELEKMLSASTAGQQPAEEASEEDEATSSIPKQSGSAAKE